MQLNSKNIVLAIFVLVVAALAWYFWSASHSADESGPAPTSGFAPSMDGTVPDGDIVGSLNDSTLVGGTGLPYGELRRMFDYYLSALGEKTLDEIIAQIRLELDKLLKPTQADAAKVLLDKYLQYKRDLIAVEEKARPEGGVKAIRERFNDMQALRAQIFTPIENEGMFGLDDAYDLDALARLDVAYDNSLSAEQKRDRLAALDAAMPKALREEREAPRQIIMLEERAAAMRAQGASEQDIFNMRAKAINPEAATRLAEVDREEAAWKARIDTYLQERSKLLEKMGQVTATEREAALRKLQQSLFNADEIPRLVAYEPV
jgi:lipase chaperone LimK